MTNGRYIDIENETLRARLAELKAAALAMADAVDRYVRQECLRSELLHTNDRLREIAIGGGAQKRPRPLNP